MKYQGGDRLKFYKWRHLAEDLRMVREQAMQVYGTWAFRQRTSSTKAPRQKPVWHVLGTPKSQCVWARMNGRTESRWGQRYNGDQEWGTSQTRLVGCFKDLSFIVNGMGNHKRVLSRREWHDLTVFNRFLLPSVLKIDWKEVRTK